MINSYDKIKCPHCGNEIEIEMDIEVINITAYDITPKEKIINIKDLTNLDSCPDCRLLKINCTCRTKETQVLLYESNNISC